MHHQEIDTNGKPHTYIKTHAWTQTFWSIFFYVFSVVFIKIKFRDLKVQFIYFLFRLWLIVDEIMYYVLFQSFWRKNYLGGGNLLNDEHQYSHIFSFKYAQSQLFLFKFKLRYLIYMKNRIRKCNLKAKNVTAMTIDTKQRTMICHLYLVEDLSLRIGYNDELAHKYVKCITFYSLHFPPHL